MLFFHTVDQLFNKRGENGIFLVFVSNVVDNFSIAGSSFSINHFHQL